MATWLKVLLTVVLVPILALGAVTVHEIGHCVSWWRSGNEGPCKISLEPPSQWIEGDTFRAQTEHGAKDHLFLTPLTLGLVLVGVIGTVWMIGQSDP